MVCVKHAYVQQHHSCLHGNWGHTIAINYLPEIGVSYLIIKLMYNVSPNLNKTLSIMTQTRTYIIIFDHVEHNLRS